MEDCEPSPHALISHSDLSNMRHARGIRVENEQGGLQLL